MMKTISRLTGVFVALAACSSAFAAESATPSGVMVGVGNAKFNGLLQPWFVNDTGTTADSNFRLRRAEIKFSGSVVESTRWVVMIDPAKALTTGPIAQTNDNKILQDLLVGFAPVKGFEFIAGQFKTPTTAEGLDSSATLLFPERSLVARTYGDKREPGVMMTYAFPTGDAHPTGLSLMFSNGQRTNVDDTTVEKDLTLRFDTAPCPHTTAGVFTQLGDFKYAQKGRVGANVRFMPGDAVLRAEYVEAKDSGARNRGFVVDGGYTFAERVQPVVRYEVLKPVGAGTNRLITSNETTFGANYFIFKNNSKIQASYTILHNNMLGNGGTPIISNGGRGTVFTLAFQGAI